MFKKYFTWTPQNVLSLVRLGAKFACVWPPDLNTTVHQRFLQDLWLIVTIANLIFFQIAVFREILKSYHDPYAFTKNLMNLMILMDILIHIIIFTNHRQRCQILLSEVIDFFKNATSHQKLVVNNYFKRYAIYHVLFICGHLMGASYYIIVPVIESNQFPISAIYPFTTGSKIITTLLYLNQLLATYQTLGLVFGDIILITFIWYAAARLELLGEKMSRVKNNRKLQLLIHEHHQIISCVNEIAKMARPTLVKSVAIISLIVVNAGLQLISVNLCFESSMLIIARFFIIYGIANLRLYFCAWPATDLIDASEQIAFAVYDCDWLSKPITMQRSMAIIMLRSQKPLVIQFKNFIVLSKMSVAKFYYLTISYVTTLKVIMMDNK
ncbi:odorant receptor 67a-like [Prorops nasuta]|uniref:odorant receptor 67a-like n=1 Tax=Prorops nasuta TaxID=863751 RepID=UPI0034CE1E1D